MKVNVTLEYASMEEAVVALGKLIGGRAARAAAEPKVAKAPDWLVEKLGVAAPEAAPAAEQAQIESPLPRPRKTRSDKGGDRGPYKKSPSAGAAPAPSTAPSTAAAPPEAPAGAEVAPPPSAPAGAEATLDEAQNALEAVFKAKGLTKAQELLGQFGAARLRDLPAAEYGAFVALVKSVL